MNNVLDFPRSVTTPSVAIVGAGAIGATVAWALQENAHVLLCRRRRDTPMTISLPGRPEEPIDAAVLTDPHQVAAPVDWIVLATKAHDVPDAMPWLRALTGPRTRIAILQNGIDHADRVRELVDASRVVPVTVFTIAERAGADRVLVKGLGRLSLPPCAVAEEFAALLNPELPVLADESFHIRSWEKLILNSAYSSLTALTLRNADVVQEPQARAVVTDILREGVAIAHASGIDLGPDAAERLLASLDSLPSAATSSMRLDREHGRALEHEFISGALVRKADVHGIAAPTIRTVHRLLAGVAPARSAA